MAVLFAFFFARCRKNNFKNFRIIQTATEYTMPAILVKIGRVLSENER